MARLNKMPNSLQAGVLQGARMSGQPLGFMSVQTTVASHLHCTSDTEGVVTMIVRTRARVPVLVRACESDGNCIEDSNAPNAYSNCFSDQFHRHGWVYPREAAQITFSSRVTRLVFFYNSSIGDTQAPEFWRPPVSGWPSLFTIEAVPGGAILLQSCGAWECHPAAELRSFAAPQWSLKAGAHTRMSGFMVAPQDICDYTLLLTLTLTLIITPGWLLHLPSQELYPS